MKVNFFEEIPSVLLTYEDDNYEIDFTSGTDKRVWCFVRKNNKIIFQHILQRTNDFCAPLKLPFIIRTELLPIDIITMNNLKNNFAEVFIDDRVSV